MTSIPSSSVYGVQVQIESNFDDTSVEVKTDITPAMFNVDIETTAYLPSHSPFHKVFNERPWDT